MMAITGLGQEQFVCCQPGELGKEPAAEPGTINGDAFDRFTLAHFASGVVSGSFNSPWWATATGAVLWEVAERPLKDRWPGAFPHSSQDSLANAVVDVLAVMAGWWATRLLFDASTRT
jgi:hypothetical protein